MHIAGGKVTRESLQLHAGDDALLMDRGWLEDRHTYHLLAVVEEQTRAAGRAAGHSQSYKDGAIGEMSKGEGDEHWRQVADWRRPQ